MRSLLLAHLNVPAGVYSTVKRVWEALEATEGILADRLLIDAGGLGVPVTYARLCKSLQQESKAALFDSVHKTAEGKPVCRYLIWEFETNGPPLIENRGRKSASDNSDKGGERV